MGMTPHGTHERVAREVEAAASEMLPKIVAIFDKPPQRPEMVRRIEAVLLVNFASQDFDSIAREIIEAMRPAADDQRNAYFKIRGKVMWDAEWESAIDAALK